MGAHTLTPKIMKSNSAHSLHVKGMESNQCAALGIEPAYRGAARTKLPLISDNHCKAVNVDLGKEKDH